MCGDVIRRITRYSNKNLHFVREDDRTLTVSRENQQLIAIRLDPDLLAAVDKKRATNRQSRSEFVREAIFAAVKDLGLSKDLIYPQDRVGKAKGGRPRKVQIEAIKDDGKRKQA